ncbi:glycoside hydrolase [Roridomyces roridus]|uniref:glucan endo-1,3-beta-D-glucosidase n=1 Tax=Roridomyces roridus TaxID=1738132 RepID=A0AAD7BSJ8_9AGAR|nr:glycoside hydrolase [Roridomyces roridus]
MPSLALLALGLLAGIVSSASAYPYRNGSRLDQIRSMYAWEGFVYSITACQSQEEMTRDFTRMKSRGARTVITFDFCEDGADVGYYDDVILAAERAEMFVIPLAWTLPIHVINQNYTANDTFLIKSVPRILAVTEAVIRNPGPVLAVAVGDEPLYDNDAGSPSALASYVTSMRANFTSAGLTIPISISELAYGWQSSSGNITDLASQLDFFMINEFPYFAQNAEAGGDPSTWTNFLADLEYFEGLAGGRPLLVTQTGWPSNEDEFAPNSPAVVASVASEKAYWDLLDGHCEDYFKLKNIGWMWRSYRDDIEGWGVVELNGTDKWEWEARVRC